MSGRGSSSDCLEWEDVPCIRREAHQPPKPKPAPVRIPTTLSPTDSAIDSLLYGSTPTLLQSPAVPAQASTPATSATGPKDQKRIPGLELQPYDNGAAHGGIVEASLSSARSERSQAAKSIAMSIDGDAITPLEPQFGNKAPSTIRPDYDQRPVNVTCANCNQPGHDVKLCIRPSSHYSNAVGGCAICNTKHHNLDACQKYRIADISEKVDLLIRSRGDKPPLVSDMPWWELLARYQHQGYQYYGHFPWSPQFTSKFVIRSHRHPELLRRYEENFDPRLLPADPATCSLRRVQATFRISFPIKEEALILDDDDLSAQMDDPRMAKRKRVGL